MRVRSARENEKDRSSIECEAIHHQLTVLRLPVPTYLIGGMIVLAVLAALAFFALAGNFWGYCAVIGAGFLALSFVMALDLRWAPLEFGAAWACVLALLGLRLRRLGRQAGSGESG